MLASALKGNVTYGRSEKQYIVTKFMHTPGVYYDRRGYLTHVASTWKTIVRIDTKVLNTRRKQIQSYLGETDKLCNAPNWPDWQPDIKKTCENMHALAQRDLLHTESLSDRLTNIHTDPTHSLTQRGLVDGIGTIAKSLFGVMDANDEKLVNEQLDLLTNKQETLKHAIDNQLQILNVTIGHINNLEHTIEHGQKAISDHLTNLYYTQDGIILRQLLDEHFTVLSTLLSDLSRDLNDILNYLNSIKTGHLPMHITPVDSIINQLKEAALHIPKNTYFPFALSTKNWLEIEKFIKINAYCQNGVIFTILNIPLITYPTYDILDVIPLPIYGGNNTLALTTITYTTVAISKDTNTFILLHSNSLSNCINIHDYYTCEQKQPVYRITSEAPCEIQLYTTPANTNNCKTKYVHNTHPIIISLHQNNAWLYSTPKEQNIDVDCSNATFSDKIYETGLITAFYPCKIMINDITLQTAGIISQNTIEARIPEYNVTFTPSNFSSLEIPHIHLKKVIQNPTELIALQTKLTTTQTNLEKEFNFWDSHKHLICATTPSILTILIVSGILIYILKKIKKTPSPLPTFNIERPQRTVPMRCRPNIPTIPSIAQRQNSDTTSF